MNGQNLNHESVRKASLFAVSPNNVNLAKDPPLQCLIMGADKRPGWGEHVVHRHRLVYRYMVCMYGWYVEN